MGSINTNLRIKHFVHNLQHLLKNFHHPFRPSDFFPVQLPIFFNLQQSSLIKNLQQPNPRVHIPNVTHNMKTTKNQSIKGSFGELPSLWEPSSLVVLQISNGMYIYIFTHGQSGGAHQTASKGWRWFAWKDFQRSVLSICIRWCKGSSKLEHVGCMFCWIDSKNMLHITRLIHMHNMLTVPLTKKITDKRSGVWVAVTCFYWKFGFPDRICPPIG